MSANPNSNNTNGSKLVKVIVLSFLGAVMVGLPIAGYFIGSFIGMHMAASDITQGYAFGGLLATVYNATHNSVYNQESQVVTALGISLGQSDVTTLEVLGLAVGLMLDAPVAVIFHREYKELD